MIDLQEFIEKLNRNADTFRSLLDGISAQQATWRPAADRWSLLMVIAHLLDEERDDFRIRVDYTLHRPGESWPPADPVAWVTQHDYASRDHQQVLMEFLAERARSVAWLRALDSVDWNVGYNHPSGRHLTVGDLVSSWLEHDYLHMRQIIRLLFDYVAVNVAPYDIGYAGQW